ncbi:periplasmic heavy metal sensor [Rhodopseudomonas sp. B29]|uniref:periplasmic heavy metal sensor n=1 Tax=Rhodopseudomonas sp. B29 TaxID=95607 RepID=UPI00034C2C85|nr:periplasmic heavy metal sensor [Rhodopseudomonas sp. B29]
MSIRLGPFTGGRLLLLASLCLNVALGAYIGAQWAQAEWAPKTVATTMPMRLIERVAQRLPPADADILHRIAEAKRPQMQPLQQDYTAALMKTLRLAGQPELDKPALRAAIQDARDKRVKIGDAVIETFVETLEHISAKGRRQLVGDFFR